MKREIYFLKIKLTVELCVVKLHFSNNSSNKIKKIFQKEREKKIISRVGFPPPPPP